MTADPRAVIGIVIYHDDGTASQRVWTAAVAYVESLADALGEPDASSMMTPSDIDRVDDAMVSVPQIYREDDDDR